MHTRDMRRCLSCDGILAVGATFEAAISTRLEDVVNVLWMLLQPLLFGLIGTEIKLSEIQPSTIGLGIATLTIGLGMHMLTSFIVVCGTSLNLKERLFIPLAWLPKATVQAAVGAVAYDTTLEKERSDLEPYGKQALTHAVLSILLTAPLGAAAIAVSGPRLLNRNPSSSDSKGKQDQDNKQKNQRQQQTEHKQEQNDSQRHQHTEHEQEQNVEHQSQHQDQEQEQHEQI